MTTILRLESKHRCGVFNTTNARSLSHDEELEALEIIHKCFDLMIKFNCGRNGDKHPGPYSDSLIANLIDSHAICIDDYFFGFADERAFRAWFYNDGLLAAMGEAGVTLACYRVSHRHDGRAQSIAPMAEKTAENELWRLPLGDYLQNGMPQTI